MRTSLSRLGLIGPLITVGAGIIALISLSFDGQSTLVVDENAVGPKSWPRVMLWGIIITGLLWAIARWRQAVRYTGSIEPVAINLDLTIAGVLIVLYGVSMVYIGFAYSTFLFLMLWLWLGGIRAPIPLLANSAIGTVALLYGFLKVAYLPLPRGEGFMDTLSVYLYQLLRIF